MNTIETDIIRQSIRQLYPEVEEFGLDLAITYDPERQAWEATFKKDGKQVSTLLDRADVENCMHGRECVHLGEQLGTFLDTYCRRTKECEPAMPDKC